MKNVLIFKTGCLPPTQTFIPAQVGSLRRFSSTYVALERVLNGYPIRSSPILLVKRRNLVTRILKNVYKITGIAPRFYREIREVKPSLIHAHFVVDGIHALPIASKLHLPLIITLHTANPSDAGKAMSPLRLDYILYRLRRRRMWRKTRAFICVSDFIRRRAIEIGYPPEKLRVHYIGIDRTFFNPSDAARDPNLVLFVGRLIGVKGVSYLLNAMSEVRETIPEARTVIIGDGTEKTALEQLSRELKVNAEFIGKQDPLEVREWMRRARVLVGPSVTSHDGEQEALGIVFAEAQATGLPVVGFQHGGIPEVVRHGETGLLAPEKDTHSLAQHIQRMLTDEAFWQSCSRRSISGLKNNSIFLDRPRSLKKSTIQLFRLKNRG